MKIPDAISFAFQSAAIFLLPAVALIALALVSYFLLSRVFGSRNPKGLESGVAFLAYHCCVIAMVIGFLGGLLFSVASPIRFGFALRAFDVLSENGVTVLSAQIDGDRLSVTVGVPAQSVEVNVLGSPVVAQVPTREARIDSRQLAILSNMGFMLHGKTISALASDKISPPYGALATAILSDD